MRHRSDQTQKSIVDGLRAAGYRVEIIGKPCDLAVGKFICNRGMMVWALLEVKKKSGFRRKDQPHQNLFIDQTKTPVVATLEEALEALRG